MAAKRSREEDPTQVITTEEAQRASKRQHQSRGHENAGASVLPEWDAALLAQAPKQHLAGAGPPLRPANSQHPASVAVQQHQQQVQHPHAPLAAPGSIDWQQQEQVNQLLRRLHMEKLQRQGLALPPEYQQQYGSQLEQYGQQQQQYAHFPQQHQQQQHPG